MRFACRADRPLPLDRRQHMGANRGQDGIIRPISLGHEMVQ
jgi:hypothetical protein